MSIVRFSGPDRFVTKKLGDRPNIGAGGEKSAGESVSEPVGVGVHSGEASESGETSANVAGGDFGTAAQRPEVPLSRFWRKRVKGGAHCWSKQDPNRGIGFGLASNDDVTADNIGRPEPHNVRDAQPGPKHHEQRGAQPSAIGGGVWMVWKTKAFHCTEELFKFLLGEWNSTPGIQPWWFELLAWVDIDPTTIPAPGEEGSERFQFFAGSRERNLTACAEFHGRSLIDSADIDGPTKGLQLVKQPAVTGKRGLPKSPVFAVGQEGLCRLAECGDLEALALLGASFEFPQSVFPGSPVTRIERTANSLTYQVAIHPNWAAAVGGDSAGLPDFAVDGVASEEAQHGTLCGTVGNFTDKALCFEGFEMVSRVGFGSAADSWNAEIPYIPEHGNGIKSVKSVITSNYGTQLAREGGALCR